MTTQNIKEVKESQPLEVIKIMTFLAQFQKQHKGSMSATAYNIQDISPKYLGISTISKWFTAAEKRGFIFQDHWYNGSPTYKPTLEGEFLMSELLKDGN